MTRPFILGIGGTAKANSSTEQALRIALMSAKQQGADVDIFGGAQLALLPHYMTEGSSESEIGHELVSAVRRADGLILATPGYHGSISGLVKNAIDYLEETSQDRRVYLDGVPVGVLATAYGWQAASSTLVTLRSIVHALRGWPTPYGAAVNCSGKIFDSDNCLDAKVDEELKFLGRQVCSFAKNHSSRQETS